MLENCELHYLQSQSGQVPVTLVPTIARVFPQVRRQERNQNFFDLTHLNLTISSAQFCLGLPRFLTNLFVCGMQVPGWKATSLRTRLPGSVRTASSSLHCIVRTLSEKGAWPAISLTLSLLTRETYAGLTHASSAR